MKPLKIAIVHESFTEKAGYIENCLARAYARLGHQVAIVASNLQGYHQLPDYDQIYGRFFGPKQVPVGVTQREGCTLYRLDHFEPLRNGQIAIHHLFSTLQKIKPDIVQTFAAANFVSQQAAIIKWMLGYKLFTGVHQTLSVFDPSAKDASRWSLRRLRSNLRRALPGRFVSLATEKCFAVTVDCAEVAIKYYGVQPYKVELSFLGVDTSNFNPATRPVELEESERLRTEWGIQPGTIVCMYTGRFTSRKNPACLAKAIRLLLQSGLPVAGIFVGDGPQKDEIQATEGCIVLPFQSWIDLPRFYRAADICIWPAEESMSALDAAACGKPIILGNHIQVMERIEGNGYTYQTGSPESLAETIKRMKDSAVRESLGSKGAEKMSCLFSWAQIAQQRLDQYSLAIKE